MSTALATPKPQQSKKDPKLVQIEMQLARLMPRIAELLPPDSLDPERFKRMVLMALVRNPKLGDPARRKSFLAAVLHAAELGLSCSGGPGSRAHLVPYKDEVTCIPDYKGLVDIALASGFYDAIEAEVIYSKDKFSYQRGTDPKLDHVPLMTGEDRGERVAAYAVAWPKGGGRPAWVLMAKGEIEQIRDDSPGYKSGKASPWSDHPGEMWKKTAIRRLFKTLRTTRPMEVAEHDTRDIDVDDLIAIDDVAGVVEMTEDEKAERGKLLAGLAQLRIEAPERFDEAMAEASFSGSDTGRMSLESLREVAAIAGQARKVANETARPELLARFAKLAADPDDFFAAEMKRAGVDGAGLEKLDTAALGRLVAALEAGPQQPASMDTLTKGARGRK